jgi:hypothetical protein
LPPGLSLRDRRAQPVDRIADRAADMRTRATAVSREDLRKSDPQQHGGNPLANRDFLRE